MLRHESGYHANLDKSTINNNIVYFKENFMSMESEAFESVEDWGDNDCSMADLTGNDFSMADITDEEVDGNDCYISPLTDDEDNGDYSDDEGNIINKNSMAVLAEDVDADELNNVADEEVGDDKKGMNNKETNNVNFFTVIINDAIDRVPPPAA